jgi:hypothetical protein
MGLVGIRVNSRAFESATSDIRARLSDQTSLMRAAVPVIRDSVAREFLTRTWFSPSGVNRPWPAETPFGDKGSKKGGGEKKPLIDTGGYFAALMGRGSGSVVKVTPHQVSVGVDLAQFPWAPYIRGGTGANIRLTPLLIKPTKVAKPKSKDGKPASADSPQHWALWWYLGLTYGVWLTRETLLAGIKLPPRPHLTANPQLTGKLQKLASRYFLQGDLV